MSENNDTPKERRERLRQKELEKLHGSNLSDLVGGLGWKGTGVIILVLILAFIVYAVFFQ